MSGLFFRQKGRLGFFHRLTPFLYFYAGIGQFVYTVEKFRHTVTADFSARLLLPE
jgi:hypothetical protein